MNPFSKEHNQVVLRDLHNQGIKLTMEQLDEGRKAAFAAVRKGLRAKGYVVPDDDEGLLDLMREAAADAGDIESVDDDRETP